MTTIAALAIVQILLCSLSGSCTHICVIQKQFLSGVNNALFPEFHSMMQLLTTNTGFSGILMFTNRCFSSSTDFNKDCFRLVELQAVLIRNNANTDVNFSFCTFFQSVIEELP